MLLGQRTSSIIVLMYKVLLQIFAQSPSGEMWSLTVVAGEIIVLCTVTPCWIVENYQYSLGPCCLGFIPWRWRRQVSPKRWHLSI